MMAPHRHLTAKILRLVLVVVTVDGLILNMVKKQVHRFILIYLTNTLLTMFKILALQFVILPTC
ncbi:hypothetical protein A6E02_08100 [Aliivibrio fischeri]|nr:hypothetical protein A6E02_08100 [Aliivibrio fischeri]